MGMPPPTAASNRRSTPACSATANRSTPTLASSSLFAVTTGLPLRRAVPISSRAGSMPPMTSTTTSIAGSATTAKASWVSTPSGEVDRALLGHAAHRDPADLEIEPGTCGDVGAPGPDEVDERGADVAAPEDADPHPFHGRSMLRIGPAPGHIGSVRSRSS